MLWSLRRVNRLAKLAHRFTFHLCDRCMLRIRRLGQVVRGVVGRLKSELILRDLLWSLRPVIQRPTVTELAKPAISSCGEPPANAHAAKTIGAFADAQCLRSCL